MNANELLDQYADGRRDFSGENFQNENFFTAILKRTHPELFVNDLSELYSTRSEVLSRPIHGADLSDINLSNSSLIDCKIKRSKFDNSEFKLTDARFSDLSGSKFRLSILTGTDFRNANLNNCNLTGVDFTGVKLDYASAERAIFTDTNISNSSLRNTNFSHAKFTNCKISNSNLNNSIFAGTTLNNTSLERSLLRSANFTAASIVSTIFNDCDLSRLHFHNTNTTNSKLINCNASDSSISNSEFESTKISRTRLSSSNIRNCNFNRSTINSTHFDTSRLENLSFNDTKITSPILNGTAITNTELWAIIESKPWHQGQSSIDYQSIVRTISKRPSNPLKIDSHPDLRRFLENSGMPNLPATYIIDSVRSLSPGNLKSIMQSTFISYGAPDENFANRLNSDLEKNGVTTFFFPFDAVFGEKLHSTMRRVDDYDRIILICSAQSLHRKGVQNEIEKVLEREAREGGSSLLIPITIDNYIFEDWAPVRPALKGEILNRVVADFRNNDSYKDQLHRLLRALRKETQ